LSRGRIFTAHPVHSVYAMNIAYILLQSTGKCHICYE
jgi:hypothetical protein